MEMKKIINCTFSTASTVIITSGPEVWLMTYSRMLTFQVEFLRYNMWYSKKKARPKRPCLSKHDMIQIRFFKKTDSYSR